MEKKSSVDPVSFAAFVDEVQQIKAAGAFSNFIEGGAGAAPSPGFQAFQQSRSSPPPALASAGGAPRTPLPPPNRPLNPGGMTNPNVIFAAKPRMPMMAPQPGMR